MGMDEGISKQIDNEIQRDLNIWLFELPSKLLQGGCIGQDYRDYKGGILGV